MALPARQMMEWTVRRDFFSRSANQFSTFPYNRPAFRTNTVIWLFSTFTCVNRWCLENDRIDTLKRKRRTGLHLSNFNKGVQSLDQEQNTVWNGLYANNGGYNRLPKAVLGSHLGRTATLCRKLNPRPSRQIQPWRQIDNPTLEIFHAVTTAMTCSCSGTFSPSCEMIATILSYIFSSNVT